MTNEWSVEVPELSESLTADFQQGVVDSQGARFRTKQLVGRLKGARVEIFSNEHPPPHFRVIYGGETANYRIADGEQLNRGLREWRRNIREWHAENKPKLILSWNEKRPTGCPVGPYRE